MFECLQDCPLDFDLADLPGLIADTYSVEFGEEQSGEIVFYDTFEWSLWFSGQLLCKTGGRLQLSQMVNQWPGEVIVDAAAPAETPKFAWDFEDSCLRDHLCHLADLRALLPVASLHANDRLLIVRDSNQKIVHRLHVLQVAASSAPSVPFARVLQHESMRGYGAEAEDVANRLAAAGLRPVEQSPLAAYLSQEGREPQPYSLRPVFGLHPDQPAREACCTIISRMLELARQNEPGIVDDTDTEFLHDYRVSLRKTRSLLSLFKGVFPAGQAKELRKELGDLARKTNKLRDLDVYLLAREDYTALLPPALRPGLTPMFETFAVTRAKEFRSIRRHLKSAAYSSRIERVQSYFEQLGAEPVTDHSSLPIKALVSDRIRKSFGRIRREQAVFNDDTPDAEVHELRIRCKKLRYMLEFFKELYPEETVGLAVAALKRLQGILGDFNDCAVQQEAMGEHLQRGGDATPCALEDAMATGGLISALHARQGELRHGIGEKLNDFCRGEVRKAFKILTKGGSRA